MANYDQMFTQIPTLKRWMPHKFEWMGCNTSSMIIDYWWNQYQIWLSNLHAHPDDGTDEIGAAPARLP